MKMKRLPVGVSDFKDMVIALMTSEGQVVIPGLLLTKGKLSSMLLEERRMDKEKEARPWIWENNLK
jgi:hypothetical protein